MDFSYYDNDNKQIKLNITAGTKWKDLNIQNKALNSIFAKLDNGDGKISEKELSLFNKLFKKADKLINQTAENHILENEELEALINDIDKGKIKLPQREISKIPQNYWGNGYIEVQYSDEQFKNIKDNPQAFYDNELEKIKTKLQQKYPSEEYEFEIYRNGRGYRYDIYCLDGGKNRGDKAEKTLSQGINILRADGYEIELKDNYNAEIKDDENQDYSSIHQSASWGDFTITDKDGNKHNLSFDLQDCFDRDILDCRRVLAQVGEYLANLPEDKIKELIDNKVEQISFSSDYDDPFLADKDYFRKKMDKDGNVIDIIDGFATIISPQFKIPERKYQELSFTRDDGYRFETEALDDTSSLLKITTPQRKEINIEVKGTDAIAYQQWQLPKLKDMLSKLPIDVLEDLGNEISKITFMDSWADMRGAYVLGTNSFAFQYSFKEDTPIITFVHELGHAIDDKQGQMFSETEDFSNKFNKLKTLIDTDNYALSSPAEFFACTYADMKLPEHEEANAIFKLDKIILPLKDSSNPKERECYELYLELKQDVQNQVNKTQELPPNDRADNTIRNLVRTECADLIEKIDSYGSYLSHYMAGQSAELELIGALNSDDECFKKCIEFYEKFSQNKNTNLVGQYTETPEEIRELFSQVIEKITELRVKIQAEK